MPTETNLTVYFDFDSQNYWWDSVHLPEGTSRARIQFDATVFDLGSNERVTPSGVAIKDPSLTSIAFEGDLKWSLVSGEGTSSHVSGQTWEVEGLEPGLNMIRFRISSLRAQLAETREVAAPSTEDSWIVCVEVPLIVEASNISLEKVEEIVLWANASNPEAISFAKIGELAPFLKVKSDKFLNQTLDEWLSGISQSKVAEFQEFASKTALWAITPEAVSKSLGFEIDPEKWPCLAKKIQELCAYYAGDQLLQSVELSRSDEEDEEGETDSPTFGAESQYSLHPMTDSPPVLFLIAREYVENEAGQLSDSEWAKFQSDIQNELTRYIYRDLPQAYSGVLTEECSETEVKIAGFSL